MIDIMIDTDAMVRERDAQLRAGYERADAMVRERDAQLRAGYERADAMVLASRFEPIILYKNLELK